MPNREHEARHPQSAQTGRHGQLGGKGGYPLGSRSAANFPRTLLVLLLLAGTFGTVYSVFGWRSPVEVKVIFSGAATLGVAAALFLGIRWSNRL